MGGGQVVRSWGSMAWHRTHQSHPLPCLAQSVATDGQLQDRDSGGGGAYVEEAADGANHEAGLVEACDTCKGIAGVPLKRCVLRNCTLAMVKSYLE